MALDFNLVGPQDLPMRGTPFKPIDAVGNTAAVYDLKGRMVDLQEKERQQAEAAQNRQVMQEYLKGGGDFFTPPGIDKALVDLRGKISPDMYMRLGEGAVKIKQADTQHQSLLSQLDERKLKAYGESFETVIPMLDQLSRAYESLKSEKGDVTAREQFDIGKQKLIEGLQGTPYGNPAMLAALSKATPEQLPALISGSKWQAQQIKNRQEEAQTKNFEAQAVERAAKAEFYKSGSARQGKPQRVVDIDGVSYDIISGSPTAMRYNKDGTTELIPAGSVPAVRHAATSLDRFALQRDHTKTVLKNPSRGIINIAVTEAVTGVPTRLGAANADTSAIRMLASSLRNTPEGMAAAVEYSADKKSLENMTKISDMVASTERTADNLLDLVGPMLSDGKTSPTGVKILNDWINAARRLLGDPDLVEAEIYEKALKADVARIQQGVGGAGGTAVAFLKNAEVILPLGMPKEAYVQILGAVRKDMNARIKGNATQRAEVARRIKKNQDKINEIALDVSRGVDSTDFSEWAPGESPPKQEGAGAPAKNSAPRARITSLSGGERDLDPSMLAEVAASEYRNDITRAQADLADVNSELARKDLNGEARSIGERNKARISAVIDHMQKQAPKSAPTGPQTLKSGNRIRVVN